MDGVRTQVDDAARSFVMQRGEIVVACNLGDRPRQVSLGQRGRLVLGSEPSVAMHGGSVLLPPDSVAVLEVRR